MCDGYYGFESILQYIVYANLALIYLILPRMLNNIEKYIYKCYSGDDHFIISKSNLTESF